MQFALAEEKEEEKAGNSVITISPSRRNPYGLESNINKTKRGGKE